jgi:hypothetical protein
MANSPDERAARLAVAAASPDAANRRARAEWLALYASDAEVHDPVGTPACRKDAKTRPDTGKNDLELFYDTFIDGMKALLVDVKLDVVVGDVVARDVTLRPTMAFGRALRDPHAPALRAGPRRREAGGEAPGCLLGRVAGHAAHHERRAARQGLHDGVERAHGALPGSRLDATLRGRHQAGCAAAGA